MVWSTPNSESRQHNLFDSEKLRVFLVLLTGFEILDLNLDLQSNALTTEPNPSAHSVYYRHSGLVAKASAS